MFYNKVQVFNRDVSILAVRAYDRLRARDTSKKDARAAAGRYRARHGKAPPDGAPPPLYVLEGLAATGLRSIRYAKEIPNLDRIVTNDLDAAAVESIRRNATLNGIDEATLQPNQGDASLFMHMNAEPLKRFDVVDLDPYGTAGPFVDAAVKCIADGGLLCVTCTDLSIMCGTHQPTCFSSYGSVPLKANFCHEQALRILLACLETHAVRYRRHIVPLLCIQVDFYVRGVQWECCCRCRCLVALFCFVLF